MRRVKRMFIGVLLLLRWTVAIAVTYQQHLSWPKADRSVAKFRRWKRQIEMSK